MVETADSRAYAVIETSRDRLRKLVEEERRSLNQQVILLLERALADEPRSFRAAYWEFREKHGLSPLEDGDLEDLRTKDTGRSVDV